MLPPHTPFVKRVPGGTSCPPPPKGEAEGLPRALNQNPRAGAGAEAGPRTSHRTNPKPLAEAGVSLGGRPKEVAPTIIPIPLTEEGAPPLAGAEGAIKGTSPTDGLPSVSCGEPLLPVGGRLSHFYDFWQQNVSDAWALEVVREGYAIEFISDPPPFQGVRTTIASGDRAIALRSEIDQLILKKAIEIVPQSQAQEGFYSTFFVVPKKGGTWRPILNLKPLNVLVRTRPFKMETLRSVIRAVEPGDWLASIDLKDAYLHVPIRQSHRRFLRFAFKGVSYQWLVLPFGLGPAPFVWTKVMAPIMAILHHKGIFISPYLDDLIIKDLDRGVLRQAIQTCLNVLSGAGFLINLVKSELIPTQDLVYVGGRLRPDLGLVFLPQDRLKAFLFSLSKLEIGSVRPAVFFQHILGLIAAMLEVVPWARLMMRPLQAHLRDHWDQTFQSPFKRVPVTQDLAECLFWWSQPDNLLRGIPLNPPLPEVTLTTDAYTKGWGAFLGSVSTQGTWSLVETQLHINVLELKAIMLGLRAFQDKVIGKVVLCQCDNTTACAYINKMGGTRSRVLTLLLTDMLIWCRTNSITLRAVHLPGEDNVLADLLSRTEADHKEWPLHNRVTDRLCKLWGRPHVDLFASRQNAKLPTFCCMHKDEPLALQRDALSMTWSRCDGYAFPPRGLIPLVIQKIKRERAPRVILIAPFWPRRTWYPLLLQLLCDRPVRLPTQEEIPGLLSQRVRGKTLRLPNPEFLDLVAWPLSGLASTSRAFLQELQLRSWPVEESQPIRSTTSAGGPSLAGCQQGIQIPFQHLCWT